jgi:hypothetical protein
VLPHPFTRVEKISGWQGEGFGEVTGQMEKSEQRLGPQGQSQTLPLFLSPFTGPSGVPSTAHSGLHECGVKAQGNIGAQTGRGIARLRWTARAPSLSPSIHPTGPVPVGGPSPSWSQNPKEVSRVSRKWVSGIRG